MSTALVKQTRICIVQPKLHVVSETFINAHNTRLKGTCAVVSHVGLVPFVGTESVLSDRWLHRGFRKAYRLARKLPWEWEIDHGYATAFKQSAANVVLAEYGPTSFPILNVCRSANLPLVIHFHGYDASITELLESQKDNYLRAFEQAAAVIAVSRAMERRLIQMGCPANKIVCNPYGVDCEVFKPTSHASQIPTFLAVGRLVDKKAPHLTLLAFAKAREQFPNCRLRIVGEGPLWGVCKDLIHAFGLADSVDMLGALPHESVRNEMSQAFAFVQHSVTASNGDSEGAPVAILEACAAGLPVVATLHAGIPDIVSNGTTGYLVEEHDVPTMSQRMVDLLQAPESRNQMGNSAAARVREFFTMEKSLNRLYRVVHAAANGEDIAYVKKSIERELCEAFEDNGP